MAAMSRGAFARAVSFARRGRAPSGRAALGAALALATWLLPVAAPGGSARAVAGAPAGSMPAESTPAGSTPAESAPAPAGKPPAGQPVRYRPIGCVRRGPMVSYKHGPRRKQVALSFDDGPFPLTPRFVRMLKANHAVATFFMIGKQVTTRYRATLHEELRDGDALGDHTYTHPDLLISGGVRSQLQRTLQAIRGLSGYTPCVFRPPYGDYDGSVVRTAASLGLATILWEVDPRDYALPGVAAIQQRVLAQVRPGSIVLSHDGGGPRGQTLAAYPGIIRALRARGYRFVTVPQLLGFHALYRRCLRECEGAAIIGRPPRGSIVEPG